MQVELAAIVDWGEPFVKATYKLEGDGALALQCYKVIDTIRASIHAANTPNLLAVAERLSGGVHEMQPSASSLESLKVFPFFDSEEELETLKAELPAYLAKAADVDSSIDPLQWWQRNASALPHWVAAARKVLLVQLSSAASERVFSLFNASFQGQQETNCKTIWKHLSCYSIIVIETARTPLQNFY